MAITLKQMIDALAYSQDMIKKDQCNDLNIRKEICKDICLKSDTDCNDCNNGFMWEENNKFRIWNDVCNFPIDPILKKSKECNTSSDCDSNLNCIPDPDDNNKNKCGFCTNNDSSGNCKIINKNTCNNLSKDVFECTSDNNYNNKCPVNDKAINTEWNTDVNKCIIGNPYLKMWAEYPKTRSAESSTNLVPPPFKYDNNKSKVYITPEYCNYFGLEYGTGKCLKDSDCGTGNSCHNTSECGFGGSVCDTCTGNCKVCASNTSKTGEINCTSDTDCPTQSQCLDGICIGETSNCYNTTGQDIGKFLVGDTIFSMIEQPPIAKDCITRELIPNVKEMFENFNKIPYFIKKIADPKYILDKKLIYKNIGGEGINLYLINWKDNSPISEKDLDIGFIYDEVIKKYSEICIIKANIKYIEINKQQIKNNDIKKIYIYLNSKDWIKNILNL